MFAYSACEIVMTLSAALASLTYAGRWVEGHWPAVRAWVRAWVGEGF